MQPRFTPRFFLAGLTATALVWAVASTIAAQEDFTALVKRSQTEKPKFAERHQKLLADRYDLADRPAKGVTMSMGKPLQEGVRVQLPQGMTWQKLDGMTPDKVKRQNFWPAGFYPLPLRGIKDSPPNLHDDRLLTLEDTVEFFSLVLETKPTAAEKMDLVAFLRCL